MIQLLKTAGTVGELFYIAGLLMVLTGGGFGLSGFFQRHKKIAVVFLTGCIVGMIYFNIQMVQRI